MISSDNISGGGGERNPPVGPWEKFLNILLYV